MKAATIHLIFNEGFMTTEIDDGLSPSDLRHAAETLVISARIRQEARRREREFRQFTLHRQHHLADTGC